MTCFFFFQAEDGIRDGHVTGVQTCALPILLSALIVGFLWQAILGPQGAVNNILTGAGQSALPFLSDPTWALATMIGVIVWGQFGAQLVLYRSEERRVGKAVQDQRVKKRT